MDNNTPNNSENNQSINNNSTYNVNNQNVNNYSAYYSNNVSNDDKPVQKEENDSPYYYSRNAYKNQYTNQYTNQSNPYETRPNTNQSNLYGTRPNVNQQTSYGGQRNPYGGQPNSYSSQSNPYGSRPNSYGSQPNPYGSQSNPYGGQRNPYGSQSNPYSSQSNPYGSRPNPYSSQSNPYGGQPNPYGNQYNQYGGEDRQYYDLQSYYNSPYYKNNKKKRSDGVVLVIALAAVAAIVFGSIGITSFLMHLSQTQASKDMVEIEERIEDAYNIEIKVSSEANTWEDGFQIEKMNNEKTICTALENLEEVLERLPEGFIDDVMDGYDEGRYLEINITGNMVQNSGNRQVVGLTTYEIDRDIIRLDADVFSWSEYKATVAHELFHVIDFEMDQFDEYNTDIKKWKNCNPLGFDYSYDEGQYSDYTIYAESIENVYFISYYSKEDVYEDRAEIFSYLLSTDVDEKLPKSYESSHVKQKVMLLISEIDSHFSTAKGSDTYWKRWYD